MKEKNRSITLTSYISDASKVKIPGTVKGLDGKTYKLTAIGKNAFLGDTRMTSITLGNNIKAIKTGAFRNCSNLKTVQLDKNISNIGKNAFKGLPNTAKFKIDGTKKQVKKIKVLIQKSGLK